MKRSIPQLSVTRQFSGFIKASISGRRLTASGKRISKGSVANYGYVLRLLEEYETAYSVNLRIRLLHRASMRVLQQEKNYWARFFVHFSNFLYRDKGYFDNYVLGTFKILKTFFNYLQKEKGFITGNYHKSFRVPVQQAAPVVLTPEQLQYLITDKAFEESLNAYQRRAKDIFVFGCTVGLRVSDLMKLKKTNLLQGDKETYLSVITQKTAAEVRIPLPGYALEIIKRNSRKAGKYLLPGLAVSNINKQVKNLIRLAGWDYILVKNRSCRGAMTEIKNENGRPWKFYQHITAHTMRRTAITTLLVLGVPETVVRKISGHAPGSKEFYKYVGIAQEYLSDEVKKAYAKLVENPSVQAPKTIA